MTEHPHRPTYLNFVNTKRTCRCQHCDKPLRCTNRWLYYLSALPALAALIYGFAAGLNNWPIQLAIWALCALLQYLTFRRLKFEIDLVAQRDDMQDTLRR